LVLRNIDYVRVSTKTEVARLIKNKIPEKKILSLPFYIDKENFEKKLNDSKEENKKENIALFVGRLGSQKDIGTLLRAWALVNKQRKDYTLVLVGGGEDAKFLKRKARNFGIGESVIFTGAIPYTEIAEYYSKAKLFVISSLYEGTCMVLHEAGVAKLPIVSTSHAGAIDFIQQGVSGSIVPVRGFEHMAEQILGIINN